jgi:hypothetical protein
LFFPSPVPVRVEPVETLSGSTDPALTKLNYMHSHNGRRYLAENAETQRMKMMNL